MNRLLLLALIAPTIALARPGPQWADEPEYIRQWFQSVMQPDNPTQSCCGEADAFDVEMEGDGPNGSINVRILSSLAAYADMIGTIVSVPREKLQTKYGNPTDRYILFMGSQHRVYCLIPKSGV